MEGDLGGEGGEQAEGEVGGHWEEADGIGKMRGKQREGEADILETGRLTN